MSTQGKTKRGYVLTGEELVVQLVALLALLAGAGHLAIAYSLVPSNSDVTRAGVAALLGVGFLLIAIFFLMIAIRLRDQDRTGKKTVSIPLDWTLLPGLVMGTILYFILRAAF